MNKAKPKGRHQARRYAVQALYEWEISANDLTDIEANFMLHNDMSNTDVAYFKELLHNIPAKLDEVDADIKPFLDRPITELNPIELVILRISVYEMKYRTEIPYRVIINESLELAKTFGATEAHKYVNGVIDKVARQLRKSELNS